MCLYMWAHWRHLANVTELVLPSAHLSPQSKRPIDPFSRSCTAHGRKSLQNSCLTWGDLDPHVIYGSLGPPESSTQMACQSFQPFLHVQPQSVPILYNGTPFSPSKLPLPTGDLGSRSPWEGAIRWGSRSPSNTWFPGPIQVLNPNGI